MKRKMAVCFMALTLTVGVVGLAYGLSSYLNQFKTKYPGSAATIGASCVLCHIPPGTSLNNLNSYAQAFANSGYNFTTVEPLDSDGDGFSNIQEISAGTYPGDAASHPAAATDATPPTVSTFAIPGAASALTVPVSTFTASDNVGVTGYLLTETSTAPAANAVGWSAAAPTSYTFATAGTKTLYAWARDAAGNVSISMTTTVVVTITDATPPTVSTFAIPGAASALTVPVTTFTASDNVGVTGYIITETSTAPAANAAGWSATAPTSYTFTTAGTKTLYAWARDAAGNRSVGLSAIVTITLADLTPPSITTFTIPAASTSLVVSVTTLTATDSIGVTGYILTETSTAPAANAAGWSAAAPTSYTFATAGTKTLYAWARDAAGNVSASVSTTLVVTLADSVPPMVSNFAIPAAASTLTVPVTTFTASDNVGVTGYLLTETSTAPAANAAGWSATAPTNHTFASSGTKTLYAWAKDAAGNVSSNMTATVVITIVATVPPTNTLPSDRTTGVSCTSTLQITVSFPNPSGNSHKSTDWEVSTNPAFPAGAMVFRSINDSVNLTGITIPVGVLLQNKTYYWRTRTTDSAGQTSDASAGTSFTTQSVAMDTTGVVPASMRVMQGSRQVMAMGGLTTTGLAAIGNVSSGLVADFPSVNAGAATDTARAGMVVVKANGGAGNDILGIVTPIGTRIMEVATTLPSDPGFNNAPLPAGMSLPYGAVSFRIDNVNPGQTLSVTVYTPSDLPADAVWYKYNPARGWLRVDSTGTHDSQGTLLSANTKFVVNAGKGILTIADDDTFADYSTENIAGKAVIVDPGAVGVPAAGGADVSGGGGGSGCFIATAAFGSYFDPYVKILRDFRDFFLLTNRAGKVFVDFYYRTSPPVAQTIARSEFLKGIVRIGLMPVVGLSALALQMGIFWTLVLMGAILGVAAMVVRGVKRLSLER
jgi:hypothetical protein